MATVLNSAGGDIDLEQGQALRAVLQKAATISAPSSPVEGQVYHDTTLHSPGFYNGSSWLYLTSYATTASLGTLAIQNANNVVISGGTMSGVDITFSNNSGNRLGVSGKSGKVTLLAAGNYTAERFITLGTGDADRSLTISGDATLSGTNTGDQDLSGYVQTGSDATFSSVSITGFGQVLSPDGDIQALSVSVAGGAILLNNDGTVTGGIATFDGLTIRTFTFSNDGGFGLLTINGDGSTSTWDGVTLQINDTSGNTATVTSGSVVIASNSGTTTIGSVTASFGDTVTIIGTTTICDNVVIAKDGDFGVVTITGEGYTNKSANDRVELTDSGTNKSTLAAGSLVIFDGTNTTTVGAGSVTSNSFVGALTGNASTATKLASAVTIGGVSFDGSGNIVPQTIQTVNEATDTTCFVLFVTASGTQSLQPKNNTGLTYNSNTNALGATTFVGALSGNATTATTLATTRAIYGNNFDGSAALTQVIASTYGGTGNGFTKFSGPTTSERTKTLRDAADTILELGGSYTPTGTWTSLTLVAPVLGTPASGNTSKCANGNVTITKSVSTFTADRSTGDYFEATLDATGLTLAISNDSNGQGTTIALIQDGTGNRTITTWPTGVKWFGTGGVSTAPTLSTAANAVDTVTFKRRASGSYLGFFAKEGV